MIKRWFKSSGNKPYGLMW